MCVLASVTARGRREEACGVSWRMCSSAYSKYSGAVTAREHRVQAVLRGRKFAPLVLRYFMRKTFVCVCVLVPLYKRLIYSNPCGNEILLYIFRSHDILLIKFRLTLFVLLIFTCFITHNSIEDNC